MAGEKGTTVRAAWCGAFGSSTAAGGTATGTLGSLTASEAWYFRRINWSCAADPTGGSITITDGVITITEFPTNKGLGYQEYGDIRFAPGVNPTITFDDGSGNSSVSYTPVAYKGPLS